MSEQRQMPLGPYLRELRLNCRLSLQAVADKAGVSTSYLSRLERNERKPPGPAILVRLAQALELDPAGLMIRAGYLKSSTLREMGVPYGINTQEWQRALHTLSPADWEDVRVLIHAKLARYPEPPNS